LQTTPFDSAPLEPLDEPPPQATVVPMATSILMQSPGNDMLSTKLAAAEDTISLLEKEKQRIQRDHESLVRSHQDMQKQVEEQKSVVETQKKRYSDMEVRHRDEIEQIRKAGHDTLAMIVEQYKGLSELAVEQERDRSEQLLKELSEREAEKTERRMEEQHTRLSAALEQERVASENRVREAVEAVAAEQKVSQSPSLPCLFRSMKFLLSCGFHAVTRHY
jgi:hypothetical protein